MVLQILHSEKSVAVPFSEKPIAYGGLEACPGSMQVVSSGAQKALLLHWRCLYWIVLLCFVTANINPHYDIISINEGNAAQTILILGKTPLPGV